MPKRTSKPDFNQTIHSIYERIAAGESSHDDDVTPAAAGPAEPENPKQGRKVFGPSVRPAQWHWAARRQEGWQDADREHDAGATKGTGPEGGGGEVGKKGKLRVYSSSCRGWSGGINAFTINSAVLGGKEPLATLPFK